MSAPEADDVDALFSALADTYLADPQVTLGTMMGLCLRTGGALFASVERTTGHLIVKLPAHRVAELVAGGLAIRFAPAGRVFRQWAAIPTHGEKRWDTLLQEAREFVTA